MYCCPSHSISFNRLLTLGAALLLALSLFSLPGIQAGQAASPHGATDIGLIVDVGGIDDNSFNEIAYQGLLQAETDLGVNGTVYLPASEDEYAAKITQCVTEANALCITVGFGMTDATLAAANTNPGVNFAIIDNTYETYPANLRGTTFASEEVGYLAGTLAGLMTTSSTIGAIGGMPIPPVDAFMLAYRNGAQWANPRVAVLLDYANDFSDPALGAQLAQDQMAAGADVIFGVGGPMGNGAILEAAQSGVWVIGVDADAWDMVFGGGTVTGSDYLLTSALKRVDTAVYDTIADQIGGTFTSGTALYDLSNDGVGLAPYHAAETAIPQEVKDAVNAAAEGLLNGTIDPWLQPDWQYIFLPVTLK